MNEIEKLAEIIKGTSWQVSTAPKGHEFTERDGTLNKNNFVEPKRIAQAILDAGYLPVEEAPLEGLTEMDIANKLDELDEGFNSPITFEDVVKVSQVIIDKIKQQKLYRRVG